MLTVAATMGPSTFTYTVCKVDNNRQVAYKVGSRISVQLQRNFELQRGARNSYYTYIVFERTGEKSGPGACPWGILRKSICDRSTNVT